MKVCSGKSVLEGIAIGKIYLFQDRVRGPERKAADPKAEALRFATVVDEVKKKLEDLYELALSQAGAEQAEIFEVHRLMLEDEDLLSAVYEIIEKEQVSAEYAVDCAARRFSESFAAMEDDYMRARAADVLDISHQVIRALNGGDECAVDSEEPVILLAEDLSPSQTVQLDKSKILAFVTRKGSANSHTAILARSMDIPALVGVDVELEEAYHGRMAVADGFDGSFLIDPDEETLRAMSARRETWKREKDALASLIGQENVTRGGRKVEVYANVGDLSEVESALRADAGGIGLFRSEFLYLGRRDYPSEEEQFRIYKEALQQMDGKKVIIRTLDIGADKQADYFQLPKEENPAMGYRAIRICLDRVEIFKAQLRAILRAAAFGNAAVMIPMIISQEEIRKVKRILEEVKGELSESGVVYGDVQLGIMIETPAAVMISDELAKEVDFFSIGTNDLTQYTLAIDRQNPNLDAVYDAHHPAVLRMIAMTVENAHKNGIWAGICGELAADLALTEKFLDMGVDELSVSPTYVLGLRRAIRELP